MASPSEQASTKKPAGDDANDELRKKRARDRKSQQAMRDRAKWTLHELTQQVQALTRLVGEKDTINTGLQSKVATLEADLETCRSQNAALRLQLMGQSSPAENPSSITLQRWQLPPLNTPPTCLSDQILQEFLGSSPRGLLLTRSSPHERPNVFADKPDLHPLLNKTNRAADALSNIAGDIVRSYTEIESLPNRVAAFCNIASLFKWQTQLDETSWQQIPPFLRPLTEQLTTPHPAWIDRIPWPRVRKYLLDRPKITLDDFAAAYSTSFIVDWPYDPSLVLTETAPSRDGTCGKVQSSPVFEEHIRQIRHWTVCRAFRTKFPEMAALVDLDTTSQCWDRPPMS